MLILITGGAGFIGSHLVDKLVDKGYRIRVLDNLSYGSVYNLKRVWKKVEFIEGDVRDLNIVKSVMRNVNIVIHLASLISVKKSFEKPWETNEVNVTGTLNLLRLSIKNKIKKFIYISSAAVYGQPTYLPIDEKHPTTPLSPYGVSKLSSEHYIKVFQKNFRLKTIILRLFNAYGPRQEFNQYSGVIRIFIEKALKKQPIPIYGDGKQTRDFIFVNDVADAIQKSIEEEKAVDETINIATGKPITINDLAEEIMDIIGGKLELKYLPERKGDIKHSYAEVEKALKLMEFKAKTSLEDGLYKTVEYFKIR